MNSENSKTSNMQRLLLNLSDKINFKRSNKYVALSNLSIYHTRKNIKRSHKNNKLTISSPAWSDRFVLADGAISVPTLSDKFVLADESYQMFKTILSTSSKSMKQ